MPLVSAVMPSYNHEEFIAEAIESVLGQDFDDLELIIVDDASIDSSTQIIQKYAAEDSRIRVIFHEANRGIAKTANEYNAAAKGKFIAGIASDDVWAKDKLTKQLAVTAADENLIVWSEGEVIDSKGQPTGKSFSEITGTVSQKKSGNIFQELLKRNYIFGSSLLYKRTSLGEIRFDERLIYLNDYKFVVDLAREYEFYYIAEPLAQYRVHGKNTLSGSDPQAAERRRRAHLDEIALGQEMLRRYADVVSGTTNAHIYATLGCSYGHLGDFKAALICFLRATAYNPLSMLSTLGCLKGIGINLLNSSIKNRNISRRTVSENESMQLNRR